MHKAGIAIGICVVALYLFRVLPRSYICPFPVTTPPKMDLDKLSADELDQAFRLLSRPFNLHEAFARPPPGNIPTTIFQPLTSSTPVSKLGQLGLLPLELMANVCLSLDIASALSFSHVSRHAREAIASMKEFRQIGKYAAGCIWVFLNTQVASHVEMVDLYSALTTSSCSFCGHFGHLLSIPTVQRCCLRCFKAEVKLQPSFLSELTRGVIGIPSANIIKRDFPVLRTIPNSYGWSHTLVSSSRMLCPCLHGHTCHVYKLSHYRPEPFDQPAACRMIYWQTESFVFVHIFMSSVFFYGLIADSVWYSSRGGDIY